MLRHLLLLFIALLEGLSSHFYRGEGDAPTEREIFEEDICRACLELRSILTRFSVSHANSAKASVVDGKENDCANSLGSCQN